MRDRLFGIGSVVGLVALIAFGVFAVAGGVSGDGTKGTDGAFESTCLAGSTDCDDAPGNGALGICAEGVKDCVDTVVDGDSPVSKCAEGAVDCADTPGNGTSIAPVCAPDHPNCADTIVDGGGSSSPGFPGCDSPENVDACENAAVEAAWVALEKDGVSGEIKLVVVHSVEWPDSCLGVTTDDSVCAEVITPGFSVTLERNGLQYVFNTDTSGNAVSAGTR